MNYRIASSAQTSIGHSIEELKNIAETAISATMRPVTSCIHLSLSGLNPQIKMPYEEKKRSNSYVESVWNAIGTYSFIQYGLPKISSWLKKGSIIGVGYASINGIPACKSDNVVEKINAVIGDTLLIPIKFTQFCFLQMSVVDTEIVNALLNTSTKNIEHVFSSVEEKTFYKACMAWGCFHGLFQFCKAIPLTKHIALLAPILSSLITEDFLKTHIKEDPYEF